MKTKFLTNNKADKLILFFLGYGFTPEALSHLEYDKYSVCCVYDYSDLSFNIDFLEGKEIYLIAWSMGVWVANFTLKNIRLNRAIAINGTPFGIDDKFGINAASFQKSIEEFDFEGFKRLCFLNELKRVNFGFNKNPITELKNIFYNAKKPCENTIKWDKAIISKKDLICKPSAMEWFVCPKIYLNAPHFVFFEFKSFGEIIEI